MKRTPLTILIGVTAVLATVATASGAGLGLTYHSTSRDVPDDDSGHLDVVCREGTPTGGGAEISGDDNTLEISSTFPGGPLWYGSGNNESGSTQELTVTAICADRGRYKLRERTRMISADTSGGTKVHCPPGTRVTGGGADIGGTENNQLASTHPFDDGDPNKRPDDGWAAAGNNGDSDTTSFKVGAVCTASGKFVYRTRSASVAPDDVKFRSVRCPRGTRVSGGGVDARAGNEVAATAPIDRDDADTEPDDGWLGGINNEGSDPRRITAFAICNKG
jgi:hypothetical protein